MDTTPAHNAGLRIPSQKGRKLAIRAAALLVALAIPFIGSHWGEGPVHEAVETVGYALIGAAILGRAWCTLYIGGRKFNELVQDGPYSLSRNPLYLFSFVGALGAGFQTGAVTVGLLFLLLAVLIFDMTIRREEAALVQRFGAPFEAYMARVPRYGPRFSTFVDAGRLDVAPPRLYRTLRDGLMFFAVIPLFEGIDWLQEAGWLPVLLHLP